MELFSKEAIETKPFNEVLEHIEATYDNRASFELMHAEITDESLLFRDAIKKSDLEDYFANDFENHTFTFPYVNEQELALFSHEFMGRRIVPAKGFFWLIEAKKTEMSFGLVHVLFTMNKVFVNPNNRMHNRYPQVLQDKKCYYFDYDAGQYVQITLKAAKDEAKQNKLEYLRRLDLYYATLARFQVEDIEYQMELEEAARLVMGFDSTRAHEIRAFLETMLALYPKIKARLPLKILLAHTDILNYANLKERIEHNITETNHVLRVLEPLGEVDFTDDRNKFVPDLVQVYQEVLKHLTLHRELFTLRDHQAMATKNKKPHQTKDGFYDFDDERLYPNLVQIETARMYANTHETNASIEKELAALHESLKKSTGENQIKTERYSIFTKEQEETMQNLSPKERRLYVKSILDDMVNAGILGKTERLLYLKEFS